MSSHQTNHNSAYPLFDLGCTNASDSNQSATDFDGKLPHGLIPGTHVVADRGCYQHHGIYVGHNQVIANLRKDGIRVCSWDEFASGNKVSVCYHYDEPCYSNEDIVKRAYSKLGEDNYLILTNNCEHFANWCVTGKEYSKQTRVVAGAAIAATAAKVLYDVSRNKNPIPTIAVAAGLAALATSEPVQKFVSNVADQACDTIKDFANELTSSQSDTATANAHPVAQSSNPSNNYGIDNALDDVTDLLKDAFKRIF